MTQGQEKRGDGVLWHVLLGWFLLALAGVLLTGWHIGSRKDTSQVIRFLGKEMRELRLEQVEELSANRLFGPVMSEVTELVLYESPYGENPAVLAVMRAQKKGAYPAVKSRFMEYAASMEAACEGDVVSEGLWRRARVLHIGDYIVCLVSPHPYRTAAYLAAGILLPSAVR